MMMEGARIGVLTDLKHGIQFHPKGTEVLSVIITFENDTTAYLRSKGKYVRFPAKDSYYLTDKPCSYELKHYGKNRWQVEGKQFLVFGVDTSSTEFRGQDADVEELKARQKWLEMENEELKASNTTLSSLLKQKENSIQNQLHAKSPNIKTSSSTSSPESASKLSRRGSAPTSTKSGRIQKERESFASSLPLVQELCQQWVNMTHKSTSLISLLGNKTVTPATCIKWFSALQKEAIALAEARVKTLRQHVGFRPQMEQELQARITQECKKLLKESFSGWSSAATPKYTIPPHASLTLTQTGIFKVLVVCALNSPHIKISIKESQSVRDIRKLPYNQILGHFRPESLKKGGGKMVIPALVTLDGVLVAPCYCPDKLTPAQMSMSSPASRAVSPIVENSNESKMIIKQSQMAKSNPDLTEADFEKPLYAFPNREQRKPRRSLSVEEVALPRSDPFFDQADLKDDEDSTPQRKVRHKFKNRPRRISAPELLTLQPSDQFGSVPNPVFRNSIIAVPPASTISSNESSTTPSPEKDSKKNGKKLAAQRKRK